MPQDDRERIVDTDHAVPRARSDRPARSTTDCAIAPERDWHQPQFGAADAAVRQQILNQLIHALGTGDDPFGVLLPHVVEPVAGILEQRLAESLHRTQRRPEVVGNRIAEPFELVVALLELGRAMPDLLFQRVL